MLRKLLFLSVAGVALAACDSDSATDPENSVYFAIEVVDEEFRVRIDDPAEITRARALALTGGTTNINGEILRGNGGFNAGYSWHLKPSTVEFVDLTIELCDGMPSYVEENVDYYVDTVKQYCPWGIKVLGEVPAPQ